MMPRAALLTVPITDPTAPYHSLIYLASHAKANGFDDVRVYDTNIDALWYLAQPERLRERLATWRARLRAFGTRPTLRGSEQVEYLTLVRAAGLDAAAPLAAMETLRDAERFFDYAEYARCVKVLNRFLDALSLDAIPGQFGLGFNLAGAPANMASIDELTDSEVLDRIAGAHRPYFLDAFLPELAASAPHLVGINVTYTSQLPFALWLGREIRARLPDAYLVFGGTEISDTYKYTTERERLRDLFACADACVVGEGERAFVGMLEALARGERPAALPNTIVPRDATRPLVPAIAYEDIERHVTPRYELAQPARYLSPAPFVYYSPTRGCYWNKCTFCDYGLNFGTPTSPWRQRSLERVLDDVRAIARSSRYIYFSVDVLAPAFIVKLAQALVDEGIDIVWGAEVRLEHRFDDAACATMRRSGCVAVSVGFESGCQRILDAIDKGTRVDRVAETMRAFSNAGVAVQIMGFTGFPTETTAEALESIDFLRAHAEDYTAVGIGEFQLTPGAIVAQHPHRFGIAEHRPFAGADIARILWYRETAPPDPEKAEIVASAKRELKRVEFDRPFAGGIDTPHSFMWYERFGRAFPQDVGASPAGDDEPLALDGAIVDGVSFEPLLCCDAEGIEALRTRVGREEGRMLRASEVATRLDAERPVVDAHCEPVSYVVRADGFALALSPELFDALREVERGATFAVLARWADSFERVLALATLRSFELVRPVRSARGARATGEREFALPA